MAVHRNSAVRVDPRVLKNSFCWVAFVLHMLGLDSGLRCWVFEVFMCFDAENANFGGSSLVLLIHIRHAGVIDLARIS